tara:strand:- start:465 stop:1076 length:612 start_codon:yes stop_codon:yes gene_type:complete
MPVNFDAFREEDTVNKKFDKRTYFARSWREMGGNSGESSADNLDVHNFKYDATSFPDALGQWIAHEIQVAVGNQAVKFAQFLTEALEDMTIKDTNAYEAHISYIGEGNRELIDKACNQIKNGKEPNMFPVPLGFIIEIIDMILEQMIEHNNFWFWQEPQLVMMGNPDIIENMYVQAKNEDEVVSDGIDSLENYLKNKIKGEEE